MSMTGSYFFLLCATFSVTFIWSLALFAASFEKLLLYDRSVLVYGGMLEVRFCYRMCKLETFSSESYMMNFWDCTAHIPSSACM